MKKQRTSSFDIFIQTALIEAQVGILQRGQLLGLSTWEKLGSHSEVLPERLADLLRIHSLGLQFCSRIFCVTGPGSFTGIRVGVAFARALANSLDIPALAVSTLDLLIFSRVTGPGNYLAAIDAQKNSLYLKQLSIDESGNLAEQIPAQVVKIEELSGLLQSPVHVCGGDLLRYQSLLPASLLQVLSFPSPGTPQIDLSHALPYLLSTPLTELSWKNLLPTYLKKSAPEELREQGASKSTPST